MVIWASKVLQHCDDVLASRDLLVALARELDLLRWYYRQMVAFGLLCVSKQT